MIWRPESAWMGMHVLHIFLMIVSTQISVAGCNFAVPRHSAIRRFHFAEEKLRFHPREASNGAFVCAGHAMPIRSLCFSPDSQLLVTASDDCHIKIYDVWVLSKVFGNSHQDLLCVSTLKAFWNSHQDLRCVSTLKAFWNSHQDLRCVSTLKAFWNSQTEYNFLFPSSPFLFFFFSTFQSATEFSDHWSPTTQKLKSHLLRTQSLNILPLIPGVGQYIAKHATLTARDFLLISTLRVHSPAFFPKPLPCVSCG